MRESQREKELSKIMIKAREELNEIRDEKRKVSQAHLLGKCFVYKGHNDHTYARVTRTDEYYPSGFKFGRRDIKGVGWGKEFLFTPQAELPSLEEGYWEEITIELFQEKWEAFLTEMEGVLGRDGGTSTNE